MFISDPELKDAGAFRIFLEKAREELELRHDEDPDAWGLRAYCLRTAKRPAGLFVRALKDRKWTWVSEEDLRQGERDRLGEDAPVTALERQQLTSELARHAGKCLEARHEISPNGIDHRRDGFLAWERIALAELQVFAEQARDGRFGAAPELMTLRDFAASELGDWAAAAPLPEVHAALEARAREQNWWKLIGPKAAPQGDLRGTLKPGGVPLSGGEEIPW